jgi:hypothetical protein
MQTRTERALMQVLYTAIAFPKFYGIDFAGKLCLVNFRLHAVYATDVGHNICIKHDCTFHLSGRVISQNNIYCSARNRALIHGVS